MLNNPKTIEIQTDLDGLLSQKVETREDGRQVLHVSFLLKDHRQYHEQPTHMLIHGPVEPSRFEVAYEEEPAVEPETSEEEDQGETLLLSAPGDETPQGTEEEEAPPKKRARGK